MFSSSMFVIENIFVSTTTRIQRVDGRFRFDEQRTGGVSGNGVKIVLIKTKLGLENGFALERRGFVGANAGGEVERWPFLIARVLPTRRIRKLHLHVSAPPRDNLAS